MEGAVTHPCRARLDGTADISKRAPDDDQVFRVLTLFLLASLATTGNVIELTHVQGKRTVTLHHVTVPTKSVPCPGDLLQWIANC